MKQLSVLFAILFCSGVLLGQNFQGTIEYAVSYRSHVASISSESLAPKYGDKRTLQIKEGAYRWVHNGKDVLEKIFTTGDQMIHTRKSGNAAWSSVAAMIGTDAIEDVEVLERSTSILGYPCNELILTCSSGTRSYIYSKTFPMNASAFEGHMADLWYEYLNLAQAIPLKMVFSNKEYTVEMVATKVQKESLVPAIFVPSKK
jgi:hypothetical protein